MDDVQDGCGTSSCARASAGNASTRIEPFATSRGINAYGRCPTWRGCSSGENGFIRAYGPRVEEAGLALIQAFPYSGPLEDVKLRQP